MEPVVDPDASICRILFFEEVFPARAAQEQAEKSKLNAFGTLARLNPLNRPKPDTVHLAKWELRYEPFWHLTARREIDYVHEASYALAINNPHAQRIELDGHTIEILPGNGKPHVDLLVRELCHRRIDTTLYQDGLKRPVKPQVLQGYVDKFKALERQQVDIEGAIPPQLPFAAAVQIVKSRLAAESIDAHVINSDALVFEKVHLCYRPVFAFEYAWTAGGKIGVIEIDGLNGEVVENGEWFRDKIDKVMTREMLFEFGAEAASAVLPGGGFAIKVLGKLTQPQ